MKIIFFCMLTAISNLAFASYVNSCYLEVKLLENTSPLILYSNKDGRGEVEETELRIKGIVKKAEPSGRADSGCKHYIGKVIEENLSGYPNRSELKRGEKIKLNIVIKNYKGIPESKAATYLEANN